MTLHRHDEEILLNQWQPLQTILYDGWILRFANGYTKRANSINPIYFSNEDIDVKIAHCEKMYTNQQLPTIFKLTPFIQPKNLDVILETKGYAIVDPTSVQRLNLKEVRQPTIQTVQIEEHVYDAWLDHFCALSSRGEKDKPTMKLMLSNRCTVKGFFLLYQDGEVVACGLGMVERNVLGIFDIVVSSSYRNRGLGEQLLLHLLRWGKKQGALYSDLAVIKNNKPALQLYAKLGFKEVYAYWYRVK